MKTTDLKSFNYLENGEVMFSEYDTIKTLNALEPNVYKLTYLEHPEYRMKCEILTNKETVKVHSYPDKEKIDKLLNSFFDKQVVDKVSSLGYNHKLGLLFHGKEGCGKTSIMRYYSERAIKNNNALVFHMDVHNERILNCWDFIVNIRQIQDNPIFVILDEIDILLCYKQEANLKKMLDGNRSINNCIFLASTNYIDQIPEALKYRPSRFKYSLCIEGIQAQADIFDLLNEMLNDMFNKAELDGFSKNLKGKTLDEIKNFAFDKLMGLENYGKTKNKIGF